jgi:hypothetical protein
MNYGLEKWVLVVSQSLELFKIVSLNSLSGSMTKVEPD